jgi:hypothetical protein
MSSRAAFTVSYDGSALTNHTMDVRDLAPAMLSLGQLFDETNRVLNGDKVTIRLHVSATSEGSFEIAFEAIQGFASQVGDFLTGDFVSSALNLKELLFASGAGLLWLIGKLRNRAPKKIEDVGHGNVRIELETETIEVSLKTLRLYQDISVRQAVEKIVKPLEKDGIEKFSVKWESKEVTTVTKKEITYFSAPIPEDEQLHRIEHDSAYSIVSLAFKEDNKWRLYDGNSTISVTIRDDDFLRDVDANLLSFSKGDILICRVRTSQWRTASGLKTEYEVLKVKEHRPASRQITLPF